MPANEKFAAPGRHSVTPYLIVKGAAKAIEFIKTRSAPCRPCRRSGTGTATSAMLS